VAEGHAAIAAVTSRDIDESFVDKFHGRGPGEKEL
jgi:hypothetical protein